MSILSLLPLDKSAVETPSTKEWKIWCKMMEDSLDHWGKRAEAVAEEYRGTKDVAHQKRWERFAKVLDRTRANMETAILVLPKDR